MKRNIKNAVGISLAMAIVLGTSGFALATTTQDNTNATSTVQAAKQKPAKKELTEEQKADMLAKYKERLDSQVSEGKLTQAEADERYAAAVSGDFGRMFGPGQKGDKGERPELTDEQKANMLAKYKERLATQVTEGTITQAQADEYYAAAEAGDFSKVRGLKGELGEKPELTDEQKAQMLAKYKERLAAQVTAGKITQAEADELYAAAESGDFSKMFGHGGPVRNGGSSKKATKSTTETTAE